MATIKIFVTGGTFDKEYDELRGQLFFRETHLPEMLKLGRCRLKVDIETLIMVDSLYMTNAERKIILESCKKAKEDKILIIHGTDTMVETAKILGNSIKDKTVVLTGAVVPYKFGSSDGLFNLGSSLALVQTLPQGVYVSMNGKYFYWNNVIKDKQKGEFREIK